MGPAGEPRDQQTHLFGPYWATVGPDDHAGRDGWSWAVYRATDLRESVAMGYAYDERDAKKAVLDWARPRAPRSLTRRLRDLTRSLR